MIFQPTLRTSQIKRMMKDSAREMKRKGIIPSPFFYRMLKYSIRKAQPPSEYLGSPVLRREWSGMERIQKTRLMFRSTQGMMYGEKWAEHTLLYKAARGFAYAARAAAALGGACWIGRMIYQDGTVSAEGMNNAGGKIENGYANGFGERFGAVLVGLVIFLGIMHLLKMPIEKALKSFEVKMEKRYKKEKRKVDSVFEKLQERMMEQMQHPAP